MAVAGGTPICCLRGVARSNRQPMTSRLATHTSNTTVEMQIPIVRQYTTSGRAAAASSQPGGERSCTKRRLAGEAAAEVT